MSNGVDWKNNYGVEGAATNGGLAWGIAGKANDAEFINWGVYGTGTGGNFPAAAYFDGNTFCTNGYWTSSDKKLKTNIITEKSALANILKLNPVNYNYNKKANPDFNFDDNLQHGFIAQELETIYPEMVKNAKHPITKENQIVGLIDYKTVNYTMLIPVLTKAIQELNAKVENLEQQLAAKTSETFVLQNNATETEKQVVKANAFSLSQNAPNPFSENTTITYTIPNNVNKAMLGVFDLNGKMLLQYNLAKGKNSLVIL